MATVRGKVNRDVRLDADGKINPAGRLVLRGEEATVHTDFAAELIDRRRKVVRKGRDKQAVPPATK